MLLSDGTSIGNRSLPPPTCVATTVIAVLRKHGHDERLHGRPVIILGGPHGHVARRSRCRLRKSWRRAVGMMKDYMGYDGGDDGDGDDGDDGDEKHYIWYDERLHRV